MSTAIQSRWEYFNESGCQLLNQGDAGRAEEAFRSAIAECEQLGPESLQLASTLNNLGQLKYQQRDLDTARDLFKRSLAIRERLLGSDNALVAQSVNNLAALHVARGELDAAEPLMRRALSLSETRLEQVQSDVALNLNNLAKLYFKRNDFAHAEPLLLRLLAIKRTLGRDHPEVATVLASLAKLRHTLGNPEGAERLWRRVLMIREQTLPGNDPAVATALDNLADSCDAQGKSSEALELRERSLAIREQSLGADHPRLSQARARVSEMRLKLVPEEALKEATAHPLEPLKLESAEQFVRNSVAIPTAGRVSGQIPRASGASAKLSVSEPDLPVIELESEKVAAPKKEETPLWWDPSRSPEDQMPGRKKTSPVTPPGSTAAVPAPPQYSAPRPVSAAPLMESIAPLEVVASIAPPPTTSPYTPPATPRRSSQDLPAEVHESPFTSQPSMPAAQSHAHAVHHIPTPSERPEDGEPDRPRRKIMQGVGGQSSSGAKTMGFAAVAVAVLAVVAFLVFHKGAPKPAQAASPAANETPTSTAANTPPVTTAPIPAPVPTSTKASEPPRPTATPTTTTASKKTAPAVAEPSTDITVPAPNMNLDRVTSAIDKSTSGVDTVGRISVKPPTFKKPR